MTQTRIPTLVALSRHIAVLTTVLVAGLVPGASAQPTISTAAPQATDTAGATSPPLRCELSMSRTVFEPGQALPVRFLLINGGQSTFEVPLSDGMPPSGLTLPREVLLGTKDAPALFVNYAGETRPVPLEPEDGALAVGLSSARPATISVSGEATASGTEDETSSSDAGAGGPSVLRLAPGGALGATRDLRKLYTLSRYPGEYELTWKPLDGQAGVATVQFRVEQRKEAVLVTDYGKISFKLFYDEAPQNVENFLDLIRSNYYSGKLIHRIIPGFVLQGGSPVGSGLGMRPDGKTVSAEFRDYPVRRGTLAMSRKPSDPNSASAIFFVALDRLPELDNEYTVIGQAEDDESMRTLQKLADLPTDRDYHPLQPVIIRAISLINADSAANIVP